MTVFGVTGHQQLPKSAQELARQTIYRTLAAGQKPLIGLTSLAEGADQIFAETLLQIDGSLQALLPSESYDRTFQGDGYATYQRLLQAADTVTVLDYKEPTEEAFFAAGKYIAEHCDILIAIWDGKPSRGLGGTADVVAYAQSIGRKLTISWPHDVER